MVLSVSHSVSVDSQLMWFNCSSFVYVLSIPGGSENASSFACTWLICLWCFGVLFLYLC